MENYPNEIGGFYERRIDTDNGIIYDNFFKGMLYVNEQIKQKSEPKISEMKLPKLKK
jgi:hypothetical protein